MGHVYRDRRVWVPAEKAGGRGRYRVAKTGGTWCIAYEDVNGTARKERTDALTKALARKLLALREDKVEQARVAGLSSVDALLRPESKTPTFKDFAETVFLPHVRATLSETTALKYEQVVARVSGYFGSRRLGEIKEADVQAYINDRLVKGKKAATVTGEWAAISGVFRRAVKAKVLATNPAVDVDRPRIPQQEVRVPSLDEISSLLTAAPPHLRAVILFTAHTGLRTMEVQNLKVVDVRPVEGYFYVRAGKGKKDRVVYLNDITREIFKNRTKSLHGYVFSDATGAPYKKHFTQTKEWRDTLKRANIHCTFHSIRHHFGTELLRAGANIMSAKALLGHSNLRYTERYCHTNRADLAVAVELLTRKTAETGQVTTPQTTPQAASGA
jgi:integrase/recombinase XerD